MDRTRHVEVLNRASLLILEIGRKLQLAGCTVGLRVGAPPSVIEEDEAGVAPATTSGFVYLVV